MNSSESWVRTWGLRGGDGAPGELVTSLRPVPHISPSSKPGACICNNRRTFGSLDLCRVGNLSSGSVGVIIVMYGEQQGD